MHDISRFASKAELLREVASGKNVLHLGAVGETMAAPETRAAAARESVHAFLTSVSKQCVGVDVNREAVDAIARAGIFDNIVVADVTTMQRSHIDLSSIDVIVASDVIEHLDNPGGMLTAARSIADPHTELIITTPNAVSLPQFLRYVSGHAIDGNDHVLSFNVYSLANLLRHSGWEPYEFATCYQRRAPGQVGVAFKGLARGLQLVPSLGGTLFAASRQARR